MSSHQMLIDYQTEIINNLDALAEWNSHKHNVFVFATHLYAVYVCVCVVKTNRKIANCK